MRTNNGGNAGWFNTADPLLITTAGHEIGHGYGFIHALFDRSKGETPSIMVPLGDLGYREGGQTIAPDGSERRATAEEVFQILEGGLSSDGSRKIGRATNGIFDELGNLIHGQGKVVDEDGK